MYLPLRARAACGLIALVTLAGCFVGPVPEDPLLKKNNNHGKR